MKRTTIWGLLLCSTACAPLATAAGTITSATLVLLPAGIHTPDGPRQLVALEIESDGLANLTCSVTAKAWPAPQTFKLGDVKPGKQHIEFQLPPVATSQPAHVQLQSGTVKHEFEATLAKPRPWFVYFVQHTHTDIGYTRRQSEILPEHLRYIDEALDFCDQTDGYPDDARFRWTCEVSWTAREYLARRPADQIARLKKRVAEGRIEMAAMFLNMSEIATESSLAASLQPIHDLGEQLGAPVRVAMQNDVNGAGWCLPDYFSDIGVKYLTMGINQTRSILPFDKPTLFWWESPSGKRTLAYRPDHYMTGNMWGIHLGNLEPFAPKFIAYLRSLEERQYPFDRIAVQYSGYCTDNSRPSITECALVKTWNEKYAWPKARIATAGEFPQYVETHHADSLAVHREAWPDWWTDGFGSAARETAESRETHAGMQTTQGLLAMASLLGATLPSGTPGRVAETQEQLLFYDEHTFGAAGSIDTATAETTMLQWGEKASYVWEAAKNAAMLREEAFGQLGAMLPRSAAPTLVVFNTLSWARSGLISVLLDSAVLPPDKPVRLVDIESGKAAPVQGLHNGPHGTAAEIWVSDVPALGYRAYRIEVVDQKRDKVPALTANEGKLDGTFYALALNPQTGAITSLRDKAMARELVDASTPWNLGQLIYERMKERKDFKPGELDRTTVRDVKLLDGVNGPIFKSIRFEAGLDGCEPAKGVQGEIRLYETARQIEFHYDLHKLPVVTPEAVYVAFPFQWPDGKIVYEAQGGCVTPGKNQLPGSSSDWQTVQSFAAVRSAQGQIVWACNRAPLVQFGEINLGKWQPVAKVDHPHLYSWVMNNYWFTNFRATQEGEFQWSYHLTSTTDATNTQATRFGWEARVPLAVRVVLPAPENQRAPHASMLRSNATNLLLVEARPAMHGSGVVMLWREVEGKPGVLDLSGQPFAARAQSIDEVSVLEQPLKRGVTSITFAPREVKFVKVNLK